MLLSWQELRLNIRFLNEYVLTRDLREKLGRKEKQRVSLTAAEEKVKQADLTIDLEESLN